jgi:hypothetical protein
MTPAMRPLAASCRAACLLIAFVGLFAAPAFAQDVAPDATQDSAPHTTPIIFPGTQYEPVDWTDLDGWQSDDHAAAFAAFLTSCQTLDIKHHRDQDLAGIPAALKDICERARDAIPLD